MITSRFPSFLGHLECSQWPSTYSIFFPWLSGFLKVVKHPWRLIYTQLVAAFRGQGKLWKIRNNEEKSTFWGTWNMFFSINSEIGLKILVFPGHFETGTWWRMHDSRKKKQFFCKNMKIKGILLKLAVCQKLDELSIFLIFFLSTCPLKTATNWV